MADEHRLIEEALTTLRSSRRGIERAIERIIESANVDEEDLRELESGKNQLYRLSLTIEELINAVLEDKFNPIEVRENVLKTRTMRALKREDGVRSPLEDFAKKYLDK